MKFNLKAPPRRVIIRASAIASICSLLFIGGAYALFSGSNSTDNHLKAGSLEVGLERTAYRTYELNDRGVMAESTDTEVVDLTTTDAHIFAIDHAVPTSRYEATLAITNEGKASFDYRMRLLWDEKAADEAELSLAGQLEITVSGGDLSEPVVFRLSEAPEDGIDLGRLFARDTAETFTVAAEFIDCPENNQAQNAVLAFDVQVTAIQHTD